jgi:hypothetical protein
MSRLSNVEGNGECWRTVQCGMRCSMLRQGFVGVHAHVTAQRKLVVARPQGKQHAEVVKQR